uniref:Uncharacterized protein n=1 Tax=Myotis myotis TaxID=51298 RepID=A0A7J7VYZ4_MYOMY|nr:hypothetical protein mMyoMyo1_012319 [Myotis myotis]
MREKHRSAASCTPPTGDVPATKVHCLDQNRTRDPSVCRPMFCPLSQTDQGYPGLYSVGQTMCPSLIRIFLFATIMPLKSKSPPPLHQLSTYDGYSRPIVSGIASPGQCARSILTASFLPRIVKC